jgi:hypothetical protein
VTAGISLFGPIVKNHDACVESVVVVEVKVTIYRLAPANGYASAKVAKLFVYHTLR